MSLLLLIVLSTRIAERRVPSCRCRCIGHSAFGEHYEVGYDTLFLALALLHKLMSILLPIFVLPLLGLLSGVKPHLKLLALVIPYSGNPKVRYYIVFSLGPFHINKIQFCYPCFLLTSKGDFGMKAPPQTCQQSIFGILMAPQEQQWSAGR